MSHNTNFIVSSGYSISHDIAVHLFYHLMYDMFVFNIKQELSMH